MSYTSIQISSWQIAETNIAAEFLVCFFLTANHEHVRKLIKTRIHIMKTSSRRNTSRCLLWISDPDGSEKMPIQPHGHRFKDGSIYKEGFFSVLSSNLLIFCFVFRLAIMSLSKESSGKQAVVTKIVYHRMSSYMTHRIFFFFSRATISMGSVTRWYGSQKFCRKFPIVKFAIPTTSLSLAKDLYLSQRLGKVRMLTDEVSWIRVGKLA